MNFVKNIVCYTKYAYEHMNNQAYANPLRKDIELKLSQSDIFTIFLCEVAFSKFSDNFYCKYLSQYNTPLLTLLIFLAFFA